MKIKTFKVVVYCMLFILFSCGNDVEKVAHKKAIVTEHLNIILTPDLSNRVQKKRYPKPVSDVHLMGSILENYYPSLYEYDHRISGQKDAIQLAFTNSNIVNEYDFDGEYLIDINKKEEANPLYLKTFDGTVTQFKKESIDFIAHIDTLYEKTNLIPAGADIGSFFKNKLNSIVKKGEFNDVQGYSISTKFRNILVLFTDGYVEAGIYGSKNCIGNTCYFLDGTVINNFRDDYKVNGKGKPMKDFFKDEGYGIIPIDNENLKDVEILVCELYDRSLNKRTGSQTVIPNDLDIIKLFWEDWLEASGFKRYKLLDKVNSIDEFQNDFKSFIHDENF